MRDRLHESLTTTKEHTLIPAGLAFGTGVTTSCIEHNELAAHCSQSLSVGIFVFLVFMITLLRFPKKIGETLYNVVLLYNVVHVLSMCLFGCSALIYNNMITPTGAPSHIPRRIYHTVTPVLSHSHTCGCS